jgi:hypothetical protein
VASLFSHAAALMFSTESPPFGFQRGQTGAGKTPSDYSSSGESRGPPFLEPAPARSTWTALPAFVSRGVCRREIDSAQRSEVTEQMKKDGVIYHLSRMGEAGMDALSAALSSTPGADSDRYHPFSAEHRIAPTIPEPLNPSLTKRNPYFAGIQQFVADTYDRPDQAWRRIDYDWLSGFGQLALDLDNDTNNTSLVLAFEFEKTNEVLLFVGDAQVGNWQSWGKVEFTVPGRATPMPALDLLGRTVFYKVGHHCSHNATLRTGGLELMNRDDLVAFIPLDQETASKQGTKGWDMPAHPLFKALNEKAVKRVVISDLKEKLTPEATSAGVVATDTYIDYFLR